MCKMFEMIRLKTTEFKEFAKHVGVTRQRRKED